MKFADVPQYTNDGNYVVNVPLDMLESNIERWEEDGLDINPDFQRGHVWDEERQIAFVEHILQGGKGSEEIRFNCKGWMITFEGPFVLVDGLQRLTAMRRFLADEIPAFGHFLSEFEDRNRLMRYCLLFRVNDLRSRADVLKWYLEINTGGVVHTQEELDRVRVLLAAELKE